MFAAYSGDMCSPGEKLYTLDYYLKLAEEIVNTGAHVLAVLTLLAGVTRPVPAVCFALSFLVLGFIYLEVHRRQPTLAVLVHRVEEAAGAESFGGGVEKLV